MLNNFCDTSPIISCSSGTRDNVALSLIRISGCIEPSFFTPYLSRLPSQPRTQVLTQLRDPFTGTLLDEIIFSYFLAPNSFTGENIFELAVHGNRLNVERIILLFTEHSSIREALPGEFTFRAHKNHKLTLTQIEGLDLFLNAQTPMALDAGFSTLHGDLFSKYKSLYDQFLNLKTSFELWFEFSEDAGEEESYAVFRSSLFKLHELTLELYKRTQLYSDALLRPAITLIGAPNSGKSTLFNILVGHDRSIVSPIKGTTRDYVTETLSIEGIPFVVQDTAGLREESDDQIERAGIERTYQLVDRSFFKILLINPADDSQLINSDSLTYDLVLSTHGDLSPQHSRADLHVTFLPTGPIGPNSGPIGPVEIDEKIRSLVLNKYKLISSGSPILLKRHRESIIQMHNASQQMIQLIDMSNDPLLFSEFLRQFNSSLSELMGEIDSNQVLDHLFTNFCIGK